MKAIILGCGTSSGVPRIGGDWGACDPAEPRNARTRASIVIASATTRILVDSSPDMRGQLLAADIADFDAVIWTHDHADHCHGIDDLRQIFHLRGGPVAGYARRSTLDSLTQRFAYVFKGNKGYPATCSQHLLSDDQMIGDIAVAAIDMPHGPITAAGLRFEHKGKAIGYATDFSVLDDDAIAFFSGLDVWIVDALREREHPTHPHLAMTLDAIARCKPRRAVLTHMDQSMDYATLCAGLPAGTVPGHDNMVIEA
ncbi:MAG: MBL fold metallo-hydrolase [Sphingomonadales bacterium]|nr:MBL fold metallo-hydrolase [Sphingomonadales bacterium]